MVDRRRFILRLAILAACTLPSWACAGSSSAPSDRLILTRLDYLQAGDRALGAFLESREAEEQARLAGVLERCRAATVRVEVDLRTFPDGQVSAYFSGVLFDGGKLVLTAGHGFEQGPGARARVIFPDGRSSGARLLLCKNPDPFEGPQDDWAVLELDRPAPLAGLTFGSIEPGGLAFILGYGHRSGIDPAGRAAFSLGEGQPLSAHAALGRLRAGSAMEFDVVAGAWPIQGGSGGPVVDLDGALVGIAIQINLHFGQRGDFEHTDVAMAIDAIRRELAELELAAAAEGAR